MRMCKCAAVLLSLLLLCACGDVSWAVGCWKTDDPSGYYFELYDDGRCVMFDAADAWVSEGMYTVRGRRLHFKTDTGRFTWQKTEHGMAFDNGTTTLYYTLEK